MFPIFWYANQVLASFAPFWVWIAVGVPAAVFAVMYLSKNKKGAVSIAAGTLITLLFVPSVLPLLVDYETANTAVLPAFVFVLDYFILSALVSVPFLLVAETSRIEYRPTTRCCALCTWTLALVPSRLDPSWGEFGFYAGVGIAFGVTFLAIIGLFPDVQDLLHEEISARVRYPVDPPARAPGARISVVCSEDAAKKDEQKKGKFYLGIALVTQGPALPLVKDVQFVKESPPLDLSWLVSFLKRRPLTLHPEVFGIEIAFDGNAAQYGFFARGANKDQALRKALAIKRRLEADFEGLECMAFTRPVTGELLSRGLRLHEVRLPRGFYKKLPLLERWGTLLAQRKVPVQMFITFEEVSGLQQKILRHYATYALATHLPHNPHSSVNADRLDSPALLGTWGVDSVDPLFRVQIHVYPRLATATEATDFRASMEAFRAAFRNLDGRLITVSPASFMSWRRVLKLRRVRGRETTSKALDFGFPLTIPMRRGVLFPGEKFDPVPGLTLESPDRIVIGYRVAHGRRTEQVYGFRINNLKRHLLVLGIPGTGKTFLLSSVVQQLRAKAPRVGILVVNIAKAHQEGFYGVPPENIFRAHTPRFQMPYFCYPPAEMADWNKFLEESAKSLALAMALGGWDLPYKKMVEAFATSLAQHQQVPETLEAMFDLFEAALRTRDYGSAQAKIVSSIMNRVDYLRGEKELLQAARVLPPGMRPEWFERLAHGETVYLDFHPASKDEDFFYLFTLFNILDTFAQQYPPSEGEPLRYAIVFDESHTITSWSPANMAGQENIPPQGAEINRVFRTHLTEDRSRGIGYVIADQQVAGLPESAFEIPAVQLFFTVGRATSHAITNNPEEQALLTLLEERQVVVHDVTESPKHFIIHVRNVIIPREVFPPPALPSPPSEFARIEALVATNPETVYLEVLDAGIQTHLRAHAATLASQGNLEGALKTLWLLGYNSAYHLFPPGQAPAPGTSIRDLFTRLDTIARPDLRLSALVLADFEHKFDDVDAIRTRASIGTLQPGDISEFDRNLDAITRVYRSLLAENEDHESIGPALAPPSPQVPELPSSGNISEVEILRHCRAWRPECISPSSIKEWRARVLDLAQQGRSPEAFAIMFFLWHHLFRRLVDGATAPVDVNFQQLGHQVWASLPIAKQALLGSQFRALCDRVENLSLQLTQGTFPATPENATLVRETFLALEEAYLCSIDA